jgi:hypothetical protein
MGHPGLSSVPSSTIYTSGVVRSKPGGPRLFRKEVPPLDISAIIDWDSFK